MQISISFKRVSVDRQAAHEGASGTIDLLIRLFDTSGEVARILVENKLDSSFTPTQPQRYASSAIAMSRTGRPAYPVICAPAEYLARSKYLAPFKARISYQDISGWTADQDLSLVEDAILRFLMPYEPNPDSQVKTFHEGYVNLARQIAPELILKPNPNPRGERPKDSHTIYFATKHTLAHYAFLPTLRFSHQCRDSSAPSASVKIMFAGWAKYESLIEALARKSLGNTNFYIRKANTSLAVVCDTPRLENTKPVGSQLDAVSAGIRAAAALRAWMYANEETLREWAGAVNAVQQKPGK